MNSRSWPKWQRSLEQFWCWSFVADNDNKDHDDDATVPTVIIRMVTMTRRRMIVLPHGHESPHLLHTGGNDWRKHGAVFIRVDDFTSKSFWGPIVVSFARVSKHFLFIAFWIILLMLMIWLSRPKTICEYIKCKVYDSSYSDSQINYLWVMSIDWVTQQRKAIAALFWFQTVQNPRYSNRKGTLWMFLRQK